MATTDFSFTSVLTYNGSNYGDMTLEAQKPGGTAFGAFVETSHFLYLGHDSKFDMAIFDIDTAGSLGTLKYEYYNGSAWTEFNPSSALYAQDPDDNEDTQYAFDADGAEMFPENRLDDWSTTAINSTTKYWIRISSPTSVTQNPTFKRIQMRPVAAYCSTKDVFDLLQMSAVLGGTDFTSSTVPSKALVEKYINEAQAYIDYTTRKSWRPNIVYDEYHEFNLSGFKLDRPDPSKIISFKIWNGGSWDNKTQGRKQYFFLVHDTGMIHFARYFLLPARFQSYNMSIIRGGGEFTMPIKVTYLNGRDFNTDVRENGIVHEACKKLTAIEITRTADFGGLLVSGMDRVPSPQRLEGWKMEIDERLSSLQAFEIF